MVVNELVVSSQIVCYKDDLKTSESVDNNQNVAIFLVFAPKCHPHIFQSNILSKKVQIKFGLMTDFLCLFTKTHFVFFTR